MPADIKYELYINTEDTGQVANLSPDNSADAALAEGVTIEEDSAGITIGGGGSIKGGMTNYDSGKGFWMGYDSTLSNTGLAHKVTMGDAAGENLHFDGEDLTLNIDGSNLTVNGGTTGQGLSVASDGTVTFVDLVDVLNDLSNVNASSPSTNDALIYDGTNWVPGPAVVGSLTDLGDVSITSVATDNILQYDGTNWVNATPATLAGDINLGDLGDVTGSTVSAGTYKTFTPNSNGYEFVDLRTATTSYIRLRDLQNVTNTTATTTGLLLQYNHTSQLWEYETPTSLAQDYIKLNDLSDVGASGASISPTDGQILRWSTSYTPARWINVTPGNLAGDMNISELNDVSFTGVNLLNEMVLKYNGSNWTAGTPSVSVSTLSNTNISGLSNGQILQYNSSAAKWENADPAGSGVTSITISAGTGLAGGSTITSSGTISLSVDLSELTDMTQTVNSAQDELIILDNGQDRKKLISEIPLSAFDDDINAAATTLGGLTNVNTAADGTNPTTPQFNSTALPVLAKNGTNWDITVLELDDLYGVTIPGSNSVGKILEVSTQDSHPEQYVWKTYKKEGTTSSVTLGNDLISPATYLTSSNSNPIRWYRIGDLVHVELNITQVGAWNNSNNTSHNIEMLWPSPYDPVGIPQVPVLVTGMDSSWTGTVHCFLAPYYTLSSSSQRVYGTQIKSYTNSGGLPLEVQDIPGSSYIQIRGTFTFQTDDPF
tara:strand:- start:2898 stop:5042 length:2145 start_codon:yes stop_codon:yes gene_type:complete